MLANPASITLELYSFFLYVSLQTRPVPVRFFYKPGRFPAFSSSVCLQTWPVPFLCMFENPACSFALCVWKPGLFLFSVCLQARSIPALVFSMCLQTRLFLSSVCLQTRSIPALFSICLQNWHILCMSAKPSLFLLFFSVSLRGQHIPYFSSCECLQTGPAYSGSFPLYVCKPRLSLFFRSVCQMWHLCQSLLKKTPGLT